MTVSRGLLAATLFTLALHLPALAQYAGRPAIVYSPGGKDDRSFNQSASQGVQRFSRTMNTAVAEFEPANDAQFEPGLRGFAERGLDPIVVIGFPQAAALAKVAKDLPNIHFTIIDATVNLPNVRSVTFREQESTFLVGMAAALSSKTGKVGFVGGMESPLMRRFLCGYEQGARYANPKIEVIGEMAGTTPAAWSDPARGAQIAIAQFGKGVDVIYAAAGTTGVGVLQAAKERGKLAIGSTNKGADPDSIITSTRKRVDVATFQSFSSALQGTWKSGEVTLGLKEGALDWSPDDYNKKLISPEMKKQIDAAKDGIISGKIVVHDFMATNSCKR
jgi:basic membrane protein A